MERKIIYLGQERFVNGPISVLSIVGEDKNIYAAYVNGRLRELTYVFDYDATIIPLTSKDRDGKFIYEASLRFIVAMAVNKIMPSLTYSFSYSVPRCIYLKVNTVDSPIDEKLVKQLNKEINKIVDADYPLTRYKFIKDEILNIFVEHGFYHKVEIFKYRPEKTAHIYECNGYYNYMYSRMVPSTGYISKYRLSLYKGGILIQYPRPDYHGEIPEFKDDPSFNVGLAKANQQSKITGVDSIIAINKKIERDGEVDFISLAESVHSRQLAEIGDSVVKNIDKIKLICIAGPSSSGKTTFSNRLRIELLSRGITPFMISLDNYYFERDKMPRDENGDYDFETINALNVALFNQNMSDLLNGKSVNLPIHDFTTHKTRFAKASHLEEGQPIIIEGIHALNNELTKSLPRECKYNIFISPNAQINLDNDNPLSFTDVRLLRRIVRDHKFRATPIKETMGLWDNVRRGEFKWIYTTQENADYSFNSFLAYELCVLKNYAEPLLQSIPKENEYFPVAERLLRLLKFFDPLSSKWVPLNSILREFIGGSCYYPDNKD